MKNNKFDQKILAFAVGLRDTYKDEDEKAGNRIPKIEMNEEELTDDFTAMVYAIWTLYRTITGNEIDILEFTHIANRLVVQKLMEEQEDKKHER